MIRGFVGRRWRLIACAALIGGGLLAAPAAASADAPLAVTMSQLSPSEGQALNGAVVATFSDSDDAPTTYTAQISWGDGGVTYDAFVTQTNGVWTVYGSHTYAEEGTYSLSVTVNDSDGASGSGQEALTVADSGLALPAGSSTAFSGAGSSAGSAMQSFEAAIGGSDNGTTAGEQNGGYRHITWDDVALNGSDPGATTITASHVVSVAPTREQARGIELGRGVAVANDGFSSVNPSVGSSFPAFSPPNIFAPFNTNRIQMLIVDPAAQSSATSAAATRGLGVMFLNVQQADTTTIQYFSGTTLLYTVAAPVSGPGQPSFVGALFSLPAVTQVVINLGSATIFNFDGSTPTSGSSNPAAMVAADDVVLAEPASTASTILATAGVPVSGTLDSFSDTDPSGRASDYTAVVSWGDGSQSSEPIGAGSGVFTVSGSHIYMRQGTFPANTTVTDFGGSTQTGHVTIEVSPRSSATRVSCSPSAVVVTSATTCTATVSDVGGGTSITPTGTVGWDSPTGGVSFASDQGCFLKATSVPGQAKCSVLLTPGHFPPSKADVVANYVGDSAHSASSGSSSVAVSAQTCSVQLLKKRLSRRARRLPLRVTCDMPADLTITVTEKRPGHKRIKFAHLKTSVMPDKATKVNALIWPAGMKVLRTASKRQRMTLKVTVVASQRSQPVTIYLSVKGVKVS